MKEGAFFSKEFLKSCHQVKEGAARISCLISVSKLSLNSIQNVTPQGYLWGCRESVNLLRYRLRPLDKGETQAHYPVFFIHGDVERL